MLFFGCPKWTKHLVQNKIIGTLPAQLHLSPRGVNQYIQNKIIGTKLTYPQMRLPRLGTSGTQAHFILEKKGQNKIEMDSVGASWFILEHRRRILNLYSIWKLLWSHGQTAWKYFKRLKFIIGFVTPQNQSHAKVKSLENVETSDQCMIANQMSNTNQHQVHEVVAPWRVKKTTVTGCLMLLEVKHAPCRETSETKVKTATIQAWTSS